MLIDSSVQLFERARASVKYLTDIFPPQPRFQAENLLHFTTDTHDLQVE